MHETTKMCVVLETNFVYIMCVAWGFLNP